MSEQAAARTKQIQMTQIESTKAAPRTEYRNPKQIQMTKTNPMFQTPLIRIPRFGIIRVLTYLAAVCFEFRASCFGFRVHFKGGLARADKLIR